MTYDDQPVYPAVDSGGGQVRRPLHLRAPYVALVFVGGVAGTAAREGLSVAFPGHGGFPVTIFLINITGAFALGFLLELLVRLGSDEGPRRTARLLLGTGFLGGYTTYSTFAVGAVQLLQSGQHAAGGSYALATVILGELSTTAGILLGAALGRRRVR
ncbi:camphor resistance protein CrcB [Branchiibius hedensis]|uniref:Fluoride-specific ion channel FluC n=1 Tax=Branchiibius hedensis TaxID=672460 RepID=A0A2Y8ZQZ5_9MICO|nr:CrcB family protein [Branchiibius hedensis]PWJ25948.1 camphor resistance protein CrcB [Branchiibius hedensis]SSA34761.1 camphor resistance protein CrcB [Branchiibius hedensis]